MACSPQPHLEMPSEFTQIPILDLSLAPTPESLTSLRHILTDVGFLYISNHGVSSSDLVTLLPALFDLPDHAKHDIALGKSPHFLGYSAAGTETTAGNVDQREQVEFATELAEVVDGSLWDRLRGPNQVFMPCWCYTKM